MADTIRWIALDVAAAMLGVKLRMAGVLAHRDHWRRRKDATGRYVYALPDIRATRRTRQEKTGTVPPSPAQMQHLTRTIPTPRKAQP